MCLSDCSQCKYFNRHSYHSSDIVCANNPPYADAWQRLETLDNYSKSCLPIDDCQNFELDPNLAKKAIALSLNLNNWRKLLHESSRPVLVQAVEQISQNLLFELNLSLTREQWQHIANSTSIPNVRLALANEGIEPIRDPWILVDSSCIDAIAYIAAESLLKIRFNSGRVYQYNRVEESVFNNFCDAESHESFFNRQIRDRYIYFQIE